MTIVPANGDWKKTAIRWGTGGTVCAVVLKVLDILHQQPQMLTAIVSWGPLFVLAVIGIYVVDKRAGQFVAATEKNAVATAQLAASVDVLSRKDDQRERETEIVLNHLANGMEQLQSSQRAMFVQLGEIAESVKKT